MAEKILNTRFQLPYDTYTNWSTKNPKLKKGEMVQVEVPAPKDAIIQAPSILIKVGDGTHNFNDLAWASGLAADIYDWAKAKSAPVASINGKTGTVQLTASDVGALSTSGGTLTGPIEGASTSGNTGSSFSMDDDGVYLSFSDENGSVALQLQNREIQILGSDENGCAIISGVSIPKANQDAANKAYVDAQKVNSYIITIIPTSWTTSGNKFKYTYSNTSLRASASPLIICTSNTNEYKYITDAEATANIGITFTAKTKPTNNIVLQIIDLG